MQAALWLGQGLLALAFGYSGVMKATQPVPRLVALGQTGVEGLPRGLVCFIGSCELLGVIGLLAPAALLPSRLLAPAAAFCLGAIMIPAAVIHHRRGEPRNVALNAVLFAVCLAVGFARL